MLDVEFVGDVPAAQRLLDAAARLVGPVLGQPALKADGDGEVGLRVQIAARPRLGEQRVESRGQRAQPAEHRQRVEMEDLRRRALPRQPRAAIAKELLGALERLDRRAKAPFEVRDDARRRRRLRVRHRGVETLRERLDASQHVGGFARRRDAGQRDEGGLGGDGAHHAVRLAGVEREQELLRLEAGAADGIDHRQPGGDGVGGVDAAQRLGRDLRLVALLEDEPASRDAQALPAEREHGAQARRRQLHADRREHVADGLHAVADVARAQELLRGAPSQIERVAGSGAGDGREVGLGGLGPRPALASASPSLMRSARASSAEPPCSSSARR